MKPLLIAIILVGAGCGQKQPEAVSWVPHSTNRVIQSNTISSVHEEVRLERKRRELLKLLMTEFDPGLGTVTNVAFIGTNHFVVTGTEGRKIYFDRVKE